jgi:hypothetical protein
VENSDTGALEVTRDYPDTGIRGEHCFLPFSSMGMRNVSGTDIVDDLFKLLAIILRIIQIDL